MVHFQMQLYLVRLEMPCLTSPWCLMSLWLSVKMCNLTCQDGFLPGHFRGWHFLDEISASAASVTSQWGRFIFTKDGGRVERITSRFLPYRSGIWEKNLHLEVSHSSHSRPPPALIIHSETWAFVAHASSSLLI